MNQNLLKLTGIAAKETKTIIGLMSGTSLDGLDIALCEISGHGAGSKLKLIGFTTIEYNDSFRDNIKTIFSKQQVNLEQLCVLNEWVGLEHARMINEQLKKWNTTADKIDLIASHGQTIYHSPKSMRPSSEFGNATLQIGDGDHIAVNTGIITISDFRQKNIAAGGEGAPLAAYGDYLLFANPDEPVVLLNIGGISNATFIPAAAAFKEIICTDIGPGNTLMDQWIQQHTDWKFDRDAYYAKQGSINEDLYAALKADPFFDLPLPRTTGPELFNLYYIQDSIKKANLENLTWQDVLATLNYFTAKVIADTIIKFSSDKVKPTILISGGGLHNPLLLENLYQFLPGYTIGSTANKGINPDAKEAILFALLANELISGEHSFGEGAPGFPAVGMGKISFPF